MPTKPRRKQVGCGLTFNCMPRLGRFFTAYRHRMRKRRPSGTRSESSDDAEEQEFIMITPGSAATMTKTAIRTTTTSMTTTTTTTTAVNGKVVNASSNVNNNNSNSNMKFTNGSSVASLCTPRSVRRTNSDKNDLISSSKNLPPVQPSGKSSNLTLDSSSHRYNRIAERYGGSTKTSLHHGDSFRKDEDLTLRRFLASPTGRVRRSISSDAVFKINPIARMKEAALERGENLARLEDTTERLTASGFAFSHLARQIAEREKNKRWYQW